MSLFLTLLDGRLSPLDQDRLSKNLYTDFDGCLQPKDYRVSGWECQRWKRENPFAVGSYFIQSRSQGYEFNAVAVLRQNQGIWENGIAIWRTNYLCCERCGPSLGEVEVETLQLLLQYPDLVEWQKATGPRVFSDKELAAAIEKAIDNFKQTIEFANYCRKGGEHT